MIQFDPPYKGQHKDSHFHVIVIAVHEDGKVLCATEEGDLVWHDIAEISIDWRWSKERNNFISIDDPTE